MRRVMVLTVGCAIFAANALFGAENLLRDDFQSDNCGGFVGWSQAGFGGAFRPGLVEGPDGVRAVRLVSTVSDDRAEVMYRASGIFMIDTNEVVRFSARVRTHGLENTRTAFRIYPDPWSHDLIIDIPPDTNGRWADVTWSGKIPFCERSGVFYFTVFTPKGYPENAYLDIAAPRLEATLRKDKPSRLPRDAKASQLKPRITPVDPVLADMSAEAARMRFYYPNTFGDVGEKCLLRATLGTKTVLAPFDANRFATAEFGDMAPGETPLRAEVVTETSRRVLATSDYRAVLNARVDGVTPLKRLNNFVSEIFREPMAKGRYEFTLAKRSWVFLGFDKSYAGAGATVDGKEAIRFREGEPSETMRELAAGRHTVELTGLTDAARAGTLSARVVKVSLHGGLEKSFRMSKNFAVGFYGPEYYRELGLWRDFNHMSVSWSEAHHEFGRRIVADMEDRGVSYTISGGMSARDPRRLDYGAFLGYVTNHPAYKAGKPMNFDENAIGTPIGGLAKTHATEAWWHAFAERRQIDVFFEDGAHRLHVNPVLDIPEISAYVNSGDGRGLMVSEVYISSPDTMEDVDRILSFLRRQVRSMRALVPSAPSHYVYLLNGWMMIGGWTTWYNPANDIRALYGEMVRVLATDPEFADVGGVAMTKPMCPEDLYRFYARLMRYYCIDGGTGDFVAQNGMKMFPGHLRNGDFDDGFSGWDARGAEEGALVIGSRKGYGQWHGRGYSRWYRPKNGLRLGDTFARFTRSAKGPNTLRQKLVGLEPGRVYQLTFVFSDEESVDQIMSSGTPRKVAKPVRLPHLAASIGGAESIHELDHLQPDFGKYGKDLICAERLVFRATSPEAEVVFCDWEDAMHPGTDVGAKVRLNYVGCHPYFHCGEEEIGILRQLFEKAKGMK